MCVRMCVWERPMPSLCCMGTDLIQLWSLEPTQPTKNIASSISFKNKDLGTHYVFPNSLRRVHPGSRVDSEPPLVGRPSVGEEGRKYAENGWRWKEQKLSSVDRTREAKSEDMEEASHVNQAALGRSPLGLYWHWTRRQSSRPREDWSYPLQRRETEA